MSEDAQEHDGPVRAPSGLSDYRSDWWRRRMKRSFDASRRAMQPFLDKRKEILEHVVGPNYGQSLLYAGTGRKVVNKMGQGFNVFSRLLAARNPAVRVTAELPELKPAAALFTLVLSDAVKRMNLQKTIQDCVADALAGFAIVKTGISSGGKILDPKGMKVDKGDAYCQRASPDHYVYDMGARSHASVQFQGHFAEVDKEFLEKSVLYENTRNLPTLAHMRRDRPRADEAGDLSRGAGVEGAELFDKVGVWEIYIPRDNMVVTVLGDFSRTLRAAKWRGPECGPYDMLAFAEAPDNAMPVGPAVQWLDGCKLYEKLMDKMGTQAEVQKTLLIGSSAAGPKDTKTVQNAQDSDAIMLDAPGQTNVHSFGGIEQTTFAYVLMLKQELNVAMGNIDLLAGAAPQSDTATQDMMLMDASGVLVEDMRAAVVNLATSLCRKVAWYVYHDKLDEYQVVRHLAHAGLDLVSEFGPDRRKAPFLDFGFTVAPYSMLPKTPQQELAEVRQMLAEVAVPLAPLAEAQGKVLDVVGLADLWADLTGVEAIRELFVDAERAQEERPDKLAHSTRREYIRKSSGGPGQRQMDNHLMQKMIGGNMGGAN